MTAEKIKGNCLIAAFMGFKRKVGALDHYSVPKGEDLKYQAFTLDIKKMPYHSSWDWLMPVIEKIEHLYGESLEVIVASNKCWIELATQYALAYDVHLPSDFLSREDTKLESAYKTVIEFIVFYNAQQTS